MIIFLLIMNSLFSNYELVGYRTGFLRTYEFGVFIGKDDIVVNIDKQTPTSNDACPHRTPLGYREFQGGQHYDGLFEGCNIMVYVSRHRDEVIDFQLVDLGNMMEGSFNFKVNNDTPYLKFLNKNERYPLVKKSCLGNIKATCFEYNNSFYLEFMKY